VVGLRLADGREIVLKVRAWQDRLIPCADVHQHLWRHGFPAPELLVPVTRLDGMAISVERLVGRGNPFPNDPDVAGCSAGALARLVQGTPDVTAVDDLHPTPAWVAWDHPGRELWPTPDDRAGDLNVHPLDRWLDRIAADAREALVALDRPAVVGHGDWYAQNVRWVGDQLHAVHDWDSVIAQPEAAIAGLAAAVWPGTGQPGEVATVEQSERFLAAYQHASGTRWTGVELEAAWAAGLWIRAFDAKKASLVGQDPTVTLTQAEARDRCRRAGLSVTRQ
jgi:Phosphotransferase enzyme family